MRYTNPRLLYFTSSLQENFGILILKLLHVQVHCGAVFLSHDAVRKRGCRVWCVAGRLPRLCTVSKQLQMRP